jgi:hypothetical protein
MELERRLLRHTLATVAYRGAKVIRDAPGTFGSYAIGKPPKTPTEILAHIADLLDWAAHLAAGDDVWRDSPPVSWNHDVARFFTSLRRLDDYLATDAPLGSPAERIFQGPIADALTHIGQLAMLRRLSGHPIKGENYFRAEIYMGRVGEEQAGALREFD